MRSLVMFLVAVSLHAVPHASGQEPVRPADRPALIQLVQRYLSTDDADLADATLEETLRIPGLTVDAVEEIVRAGPTYGPAPVGLQPSLPVAVKDRTFRYGLYVPASYEPGRGYGLVLCLHGAGFTGDAYLERWRTRLGEGYILACPTLIQGTWWTRQAEDLVLATIRAVEARYHVDPDRVFLTGMSNGGIGALLIGAHHAPLFAGVAPMAAGLDDVLLPLLANYRNTPLYIIHGVKDQVMPVELSRVLASELRRRGYDFVYREHDREHPIAGGHYFPREELPDLVAWLGARRRTPVPRRVTVVRDASHLSAFGWVRIDATDRIAYLRDSLIESREAEVVNRVYAELDAEVTAPNRIEVRTRHVRRYTLYLNRALIDVRAPLTIVTNGRVTSEAPVVWSPEAVLRDARVRHDPRALFSASVTVAVAEEP